MSDRGDSTDPNAPTVPLDAPGPARARGPLAPGAVLGGRYTIRRLLGRGGMGAVYSAFDDVLGKEVALKQVLGVAGASALDELRKETLLAQQVTHPNVCRTYDLEDLDGTLLLKMEYLDGEPLSARIAREGPAPIAEALRVVRAVASGLEAAHRQGVIHLDLKPHNIFVEQGSGRVVLMDFGVARSLYRGGDEGVAGTPAYMAPEQKEGLPVDVRADLYALGCVLHELVTGKLPSLGTDVRALRPDLPSWLASVIRRLLAPRPDERYASTAALLDALEPPRSKLLVVAVALACLAIVVAGGLLLRRSMRPPWRAAIVERQPAYDENADQPEISPDGKWLAYVSDRDGGWRLYVESLDGQGEARALTPPGVTYGTETWAADSRALYAVTDRRLDRIPLDGSAITPVTDRVALPERCGDALVLVRQPAGSDDEPVVLRTSDGRERELYRPPRGHAIAGTRCDHAGKQLVLAIARGSDPERGVAIDLWQVPLDSGAPRVLLADGAQNVYPTFAADGRSVIYSARHGLRTDLWEVSVDGGAPQQLTAGNGHDIAATASPDGKLLVYDDDVTFRPLFAWATAGPQPGRRLTTTTDSVNHAALAPDGRALVAEVTKAAWPGRRHDSAVELIDVASGARRELGRGSLPAPSRDGATVYFVAYDDQERSRIVAVPRAGGPARDVLVTDGAIALLDTDDRGWLHFAIERGERLGAWQASPEGAIVREAAAPIVWVSHAPHTDWRAVLTVEGDSYGVRLVAPDQPLAGAPATRRTAWLSWAPDGKSLWLGLGREIRRVFTDGRPDEVTRVDGFDRFFAASSDGATLYLGHEVGHVRRRAITNFADRPRPSGR